MSVKSSNYTEINNNRMEKVKRNSLHAWILAARPKTLTGAINPVMVGTALAAIVRKLHADCGQFHQ